MYGLAHVIIPTAFTSLQATLDETLAPFKRGGADDLPRDKLAFDDVTEALQKSHRTKFEFDIADGEGLRIAGGDPMRLHHLDAAAIRAFLEAEGVRSWSGSLTDVEPDFDSFAHRFSQWKSRDAETGGYGQWLNPLGRWDWWDLGGRFDGVIAGSLQSGTGDASMISSGPSTGRELIGGVSRALGVEPSETEAEIEANVELVSTLLNAAERGDEHAFPAAIVLPIRVSPDELRWIDSPGGRPTPPEAKAILGVPDDAPFREIVIAAYERFSAFAAAGVAYHF
jgi:hypothetical protein